MVSESNGSVDAHPDEIGTRYQIDRVLGHGGMATVYRVTDKTTHKALALKQLRAKGPELLGFFEREFQALQELSHPRVIEAYDYGVDDAGPYYTMELLDGDDLRKLSPLPWQAACALLFGICSSLALIHSRRMVHRDISPGNIRCGSDGQAKLIDFGALAAMCASPSVVGTPAFVAPEVVHGSVLDGRTDLFSFGATLYYALTGRPPFPARNFGQLAALWSAPLGPPSSLVPDIPEGLDALVMSLLRLEPAMRPRTAFEVMQRLTVIAGIDAAEPLSVSRAYLSTPVLVGRQDAIARLQGQMGEAFVGRGRSVLVEGCAGSGRSRLLDACAVEAKLFGATVLRSGANSAAGDEFSVAQALAKQLLELLPGPALAAARASRSFEVLFEAAPPAGRGSESPAQLRPLDASRALGLERQKVLSEWVLRVSDTHPLAIVIDDVHRVDASDAVLLAALASEAEHHRIFVAAAAESRTPWMNAALDVFAERSHKISLEPLTSKQTEELLGSLFGDVQNLKLIADGVHRVSAGNPRACMELATHLVDRGAIVYEGGCWTLPDRLSSGDLPSSATEAMRDRIAALQPLSRRIAEAQALAGGAFLRVDYGLLCPEADKDRIDRALRELVSCQLLVYEGNTYSLAHSGWVSVLTDSLGEEERAQLHRALASVYEPKLPLAVVRHLLAGGLPERGVERLARVIETVADATTLQDRSQIRGTELAAIFLSALEAAQSLARPPRELYELRRWIASLSLSAEDAFFWRVAPDWLAQLKRDSGLDDWHSLADTDPGTRLGRAIGLAAQRYAETPERDRVYRPDEAIKFLVHYVLLSIAIGARSMDSALIESLPGLLEPFVPVSPLVGIIHENAIATREARCRAQIDQARARWIHVRDHVTKNGLGGLPYVDTLQNAGAFGIGSLEARMGLASTTTWAELLDADPMQHVNAAYLRKVAALQMGDAEGAERWRRQAEVLALRARGRQMFTTTLPIELSAHAATGDIMGVSQVAARMQPLADKCPGWRGYLVLAQALLQQLRGDLEAAREAFECCIAMTSPDPAGGLRPLIVWPPAVAGYIETLVGLGRFDDARHCGEQALAQCQRLQIYTMSHEISRALALAEAKLGAHQNAASRLDEVIEQQEGAGATGLVLGASYEARARVAIAAGDEAALQKYSSLTAREYRHGRGSSLGARWERLMVEARGATRRSLPRLEDYESSKPVAARGPSVIEVATEFLREPSIPTDRAARVLKVLCDDRAAAAGHLYLIGDRGLMLVSSLGSPAPTEALTQYVREYFDNRVSAGGERIAALTSEKDAVTRNTSPCFRDATGVAYYPLLLMSFGQAKPRCAGVAVLADGGRADGQAGGTTLLATLTAHLMACGDTCGVTTQ